ncbi:MAG: hypothetical protein OEW12_02705 [Deltaproteobacteria bacterium]|nr:hypothetical protein [Deltaproteobacteria bacterium]
MNIFNNISHQDVMDAIRKFREEGGIIKKLPDQQNRNPVVIGDDKYDSFEPLSSFLVF